MLPRFLPFQVSFDPRKIMLTYNKVKSSQKLCLRQKEPKNQANWHFLSKPCKIVVKKQTKFYLTSAQPFSSILLHLFRQDLCFSANCFQKICPLQLNRYFTIPGFYRKMEFPLFQLNCRGPELA